MSVVHPTDPQSALIAVQAGVDRRDMAVVTSFRKYVSRPILESIETDSSSFVRNLGGTLALAIAGTIM